MSRARSEETRETPSGGAAPPGAQARRPPGSRTRLPGIRHGDRPVYLFAAAAACAVLALGLAAFGLAWWSTPPARDPLAGARHLFDSPGGMNVFLVGWTKSEPQRLAHRSMLAALALLVGVLWFLGPRRAGALVQATAGRWAPALVATWLGVMIVLSSLGLPNGFGYTGVESRPLYEYGAGILLGAGLLAFGRKLTSPLWSRVGLGLLLALLGALLAPAAWHELDLSGGPWAGIEDWEIHYDALLGPADRLATGQRLRRDLYGLVTPLVLAVVQSRFGTWTFGDYVRFVQFAQLAFFALLLPSYAFYTRRRWLLGLLAMLFVAVDFHFGTYLLAWPNLMGLRFLGFPAAFLGLLAAQRLGAGGSAALLGGLSGLCLLHNVDTGIPVTAGLVACLVLRRTGGGSGARRGWLGDGALFLCGLAAALAGFVLLHRALLGEWMAWDGLLAGRGMLLLRLFSRFGGFPPQFDPLAAVLFGHASAVLVSAWIERHRPPSLRREMRLLAAVIIVVWFGYYVHRPNTGCLSSLLVPYSFLLLDTLRVVILGLRRSAVGYWKLGLSLATLSLAAVPHTVLTTRVQWPSYLQGLEQLAADAPPRALLVSGVYLPDDDRTRRLLERAAFLREQPRARPLVYFTADPFLVAKLSGAWPDLPPGNVANESQNAERYRALVESVRRSDADRIYFDSWGGVSRPEASSLPMWRLYRQLRIDLSRSFERRRTVAGWEEWVRR